MPCHARPGQAGERSRRAACQARPESEKSSMPCQARPESEKSSMPCHARPGQRARRAACHAMPGQARPESEKSSIMPCEVGPCQDHAMRCRERALIRRSPCADTSSDTCAGTVKSATKSLVTNSNLKKKFASGREALRPGGPSGRQELEILKTLIWKSSYYQKHFIFKN